MISVQRLRHVDRAGVVVESAKIGRVFPGEPRVRGRLEGGEDLVPLLLGGDLLPHPDLAALRHLDVLAVALAEGLGHKAR